MGFLQRCDVTSPSNGIGFGSHSGFSAALAARGGEPRWVSVSKRLFILKLRRLAKAYYDGNSFLRANVALSVILRLSPDDPRALFRRGLVALELDHLDLAIASFERSAASKPLNWNILVQLGQALTLNGEYAKARETLDAAHAIAPDSLAVLIALAHMYRRFGSAEEAGALLSRAVRLYPRSAAPLIAMGLNCLDRARKTDAIACFEKAAALAPDDPRPYYQLANAGNYTEANHPHIAQLQRLLGEKRLSRDDRCAVHFALGDAYDDAGHWDSAFQQYRRGNRLKKCGFDRGALRRGVDRRLRVFTKDYVESHAAFGDIERGGSLIFIVGMPRSGTSLVEQILATHPDVYAGGERNDVAQLANRLQSQSGVRNPYPACLGELSPEAIDAIAHCHVAKVRELSNGAARFVDKMPMNCFDIGLIAVLFPRAKLIHCRRDPRDTCVSCFFQDFAGCPWAYDMANIAFFYREYARIMSRWHSVLMGRIHEVRYEELVRSAEPVTRNLFRYCGLTWTDRCLEFHTTERFVDTASLWQVKTPLYATSVGRWKNYARHLGPLIGALGDSISREECGLAGLPASGARSADGRTRTANSSVNGSD